MSLGPALIFVIWLTCFIQLFALFLYAHHQLLPTIEQLEVQHAFKEHQHAVETFLEESNTLETTARGWANWDETYLYLQGKNPHFLKLFSDTKRFNEERIHFMALLDVKATPLYSTLYDYNTQSILPMPSLLESLSQKDPTFLLHSSVYSLHNGIFMTDLGAMLLSSSPVLPSKGEGRPSGTLVIGRWLTPETIQAINDKTQVETHFWPTGTKVPPLQKQVLLSQLQNDTETHLSRIQDTHLEISNAFFDVGDTPALLLGTTTYRPFTQLMTHALLLWAGISIASASLCTFLSLRRLNHHLHSPLATMLQKLSSVGGSLPALPLPEKTSEVSVLTKILNKHSFAQHEWLKQEKHIAFTEGVHTAEAVTHANFKEHFQSFQKELQELQYILTKIPLHTIEHTLAESLNQTLDNMQQGASLDHLLLSTTLLNDQHRTLALKISSMTDKMNNLLALSLRERS